MVLRLMLSLRMMILFLSIRAVVMLLMMVVLTRLSGLSSTVLFIKEAAHELVQLVFLCSILLSFVSLPWFCPLLMIGPMRNYVSVYWA